MSLKMALICSIVRGRGGRLALQTAAKGKVEAVSKGSEIIAATIQHVHI
jgi:hypothetical protein